MNILITGVAGFIGSNLADAIPAEHYVVGLDNLMRGDESRRNLAEIKRPVEFYEGDIRNEKLVKNIVREEAIDFVYHLAALPSHRLAMSKPPMDYHTTDLMGTLIVLDAARECEARVVFASSNKVYGHQEKGTVCVETTELKPEGWYGMAKWTSEKYMEQYAKYCGVNSTAIRFHHAVGKRCHSELCLPIFVENALEGKPLVVNGKETAEGWECTSADFTNVNDVVRGLLIFLNETWEGFDVFNFGSGKTHTVLELAQMILKETKSESLIVKGNLLPHEGLWHLAGTEKAKAELGWEAQVPLEESVAEYVKWRTRDV